MPSCHRIGLFPADSLSSGRAKRLSTSLSWRKSSRRPSEELTRLGRMRIFSLCPCPWRGTFQQHDPVTSQADRCSLTVGYATGSPKRCEHHPFYECLALGRVTVSNKSVNRSSFE